MSPFSWRILLGAGLASVLLVACQATSPSPTGLLPASTATAVTTAETTAAVTPTVDLDAPPTVEMTEDRVPRITAESLKAKLDAGQDVVIVDSRSLENFREKHIAGALSMPLLEVDLRYQELPKDKAIVLYCT